MHVEQVAPDLLRICLVGSDIVNAYIAGDVLIDSGASFSRSKLLKVLERLQLSGHALTHGHSDHQGCSHAVCERSGIPLYCGAGDREAVESGDGSTLLPRPDGLLAKVSSRFRVAPHPVTRTLVEGDTVGGFVCVETPGHTPGHLAFWREYDGVLILGDVLFHRNPLTLRRGLAEPFDVVTHDPEVNRNSARKLAGLRPEIVCFGHGAPLRDGAAFSRFVDGLPV
ncbi:MAG: MBL fold metallo-hydrolase [Rhodothermales bacterium]|nr:MBL fold metallo-hydrolase [Rhodothermales bacterium]